MKRTLIDFLQYKQRRKLFLKRTVLMAMNYFEKPHLGEVKNVLICVNLRLPKLQTSSVIKTRLLVENSVPVLTLTGSDR